jgi:hypothetical protein
VPSLPEVQALLYELDQWKQQAPQQRGSRPLPQQTPDRVQATYTQAVLLLMRPILMANEVDPDLIGLCVEFAVEACQVSAVSFATEQSSKVITECENIEPESSNTPGSYYSVPLFLLRRHFVTMLGDNPHSVDSSSYSPSNKCLFECVGSVHRGITCHFTLPQIIRGSFQSFSV